MTKKVSKLQAIMKSGLIKEYGLLRIDDEEYARAKELDKLVKYSAKKIRWIKMEGINE